MFDVRPSNASVDRILDFNVRLDTIPLDDQDFPGLRKGPLAASAFKDLDDCSVDRNDRILYNSDDGDLYYDRNGAAAGGRTKFADLVNEADIDHRDFVVF